MKQLILSILLAVSLAVTISLSAEEISAELKEKIKAYQTERQTIRDELRDRIREHADITLEEKNQVVKEWREQNRQRIAAHKELAQDQMHQAPGVRHRRFHPFG